MSPGYIWPEGGLLPWCDLWFQKYCLQIIKITNNIWIQNFGILRKEHNALRLCIYGIQCLYYKNRKLTQNLISMYVWYQSTCFLASWPLKSGTSLISSTGELHKQLALLPTRITHEAWFLEPKMAQLKNSLLDGTIGGRGWEKGARKEGEKRGRVGSRGLGARGWGWVQEPKGMKIRIWELLPNVNLQFAIINVRHWLSRRPHNRGN